MFSSTTAGGMVEEGRRRRARPRRTATLLSVGDLLVDIVVKPQKHIVSGSDVPGAISFRAGGSAANVCRTYASLGGRARFIGAVGDDSWGRPLARAMRADAVQVRLVTVAGHTARLVALLATSGERSFITERHAADQLRPEDLRPAWLRGVDVLHLPAYSLLTEPLASAAVAAAQRARRDGAIVSVDLASRRPLLARGRAAARARIAAAEPDILFANAEEAEALAGGRDVRRLLEFAVVVIVKEGRAGCRVVWRPSGHDEDVLQVAVATAAVDTDDTTGAGDAFDAGFLRRLFELGQEQRERVHELLYAGDRTQAASRSQALRRAAVAGHRAASELLSRPRRELTI